MNGTVIEAVEFSAPTKLVPGTWKTELSPSLPLSVCRKMEMEMNLLLARQPNTAKVTGSCSLLMSAFQI